MARPKKVSERRQKLELTPQLIVPIRFITERGRDNVRASVTRTGVFVRLPAHLSPAERAKQEADMLAWVRRTQRDQPDAFRHFLKTKTEVGGKYRFDFRGEPYAITVVENPAKHHRIVLTEPGRLEVRLHGGDHRAGSGTLLEKLLAKHFGGISLPRVTERVHALNAKHFGRQVNAVKLSDTYARWGSCSSRGNINLATRLCLAPDEILDAVIIHELAHLVHADHSPAFWAEVRRALPEYKVHDEWLRTHGETLRFRAEPIN